MKRLALILALIAPVVFTVGEVCAEPFAPKLSTAGIKPAKQDELSVRLHGMTVKMMEASKVPDRATVPVPPYPGAKVSVALEANTMELNGKKIQCLPSMTLLSADPVEKVMAYYKQELKGFKYKKEFFGMSHLFWTGRDDLNSVDIENSCATTHVGIQSQTPDVFMPEAKTSIAIIYKPK